jgi:BCD family chlorophyll transporter-like MFS transporter
MLVKRLQLGLIHVAVAITLVPLNSTLNRIMVKEMALSSTLVAVFISLPYLFSPIQVAIGSFADRNPIFGLRRIPYIYAGLLLCISGLLLSPWAAEQLNQNTSGSLIASVLVFGAWGMGFNLATVSYFSLASEVSDGRSRSRTISIMFFMMIIGIILTSRLLEVMLTPYSFDVLPRAFATVAIFAALLALPGLFGLEKRAGPGSRPTQVRHSLKELYGAIAGNRHAVLFFWYLILLLIAILGQDLLLEPYGAEAFGLTVGETTLLTRIWGLSFLVSLSFASLLEQKAAKANVARMGAWGGILAFVLIIGSGMLGHVVIFRSGVIVLGLATGLATVSNLSLMLDMTTAGRVGLFIGAWGMADAFARLVGNVLSGAIRDIFSRLLNDVVTGYLVVFGIQAGLLFISLILLRRLDISVFQTTAEQDGPGVLERAAMAGDV